MSKEREKLLRHLEMFTDSGYAGTFRNTEVRIIVSALRAACELDNYYKLKIDSNQQLTSEGK